MSDPAASAEPSPPPEPADDDAYLRLILDIGATLLQELAADPTMTPDAKAEPYERYARVIRRTIVLRRHIAAHPAQSVRAAAQDQARRAQARREVIRNVEDAIEAKAERPDRAESLRDELGERLDDPEFDHDLATRPVADIIRDLLRDLGLDKAYGHSTRRTPADIRDLNARAAKPPKPPPEPEPEPEPVEILYQPNRTRPNRLLDRYRDAPDG